MAAIYDAKTGDVITEGLQGCYASHEASTLARRMAEERGEVVHLVDDDGEWLIYPDSDPRGDRKIAG